VTAYARTIAAVRAALLNAFADVDTWFDRPAEVRAFQSASGGWTIDQVLEHISLTNHFLMLTLRKSVDMAVNRAAGGEQIPEGESDLGRLSAIGQRGTFQWIRPEHMVPTGATASEDVRALLHRQKDECLTLLDRIGHGEGALHHLKMSVNALGRIDLYQWMYFIAQHAHRHLAQMASTEAEARNTTGDRTAISPNWGSKESC
jgi:hypothetical protein